MELHALPLLATKRHTVKASKNNASTESEVCEWPHKKILFTSKIQGTTSTQVVKLLLVPKCLISTLFIIVLFCVLFQYFLFYIQGFLLLISYCICRTQSLCRVEPSFKRWFTLMGSYDTDLVAAGPKQTTSSPNRVLYISFECY